MVVDHYTQKGGAVMSLFALAFQLSSGLILGAFVGLLPFTWMKYRMAKLAAKNKIDAPAPAPGKMPDLSAIMGLAAQFMGGGNDGQ